ARPPAEIRASYFDEDLVDLPNRVLDVAESRRCIALLKRRSMGKTLVDQVAYLGFGLLQSRDVTGHICRGDVVDEHANRAHGRHPARARDDRGDGTLRHDRRRSGRAGGSATRPTSCAGRRSVKNGTKNGTELPTHEARLVRRLGIEPRTY